MPTTYVLVDFENVQPDSLATLAGGAHKVKVFVGAAQAKGRISFELSHSMQTLGSNAEYVRIARSGRNAADMHIAYYIGQLVEQDRHANIFVVSKDTDFDPLIEFLRGVGVNCKRIKIIGEIPKATIVRATPSPQKAKSAPATQPRARKPHADKLAPIIKQLHSLSGKPATRKKLAQTIATYLKQHGGSIGDKAVEALIDELIQLKYVSQAGTKVAYHLT
jgi:hypothetical protein